MTAEKIADLAEFLKKEAKLVNPEDSFATILIALVGVFRGVMCASEISYGLSSLTTQILEDLAYEQRNLRRFNPSLPEGFDPNNN
tara:strand:+ start:643 stop:897 length:255 start_codon:yes stop_codon:yes gene_type:complete